MARQTINLVTAAAAAAFPLAVSAAIITPELQQQMNTAPPGQLLPVIVQMADRVDLRQIRPLARNQRNNAMLATLKQKAERTQGPIIGAIATHGGSRIRQLWIINGVSVNLRPAAVELLSRFPGVGRIGLDATVSQPVTTQSTSGVTTWNLAAVHAPEVWASGQTGIGTVIANMDTGVDPDHPDLAGKWRGGANSWFDPHGQHAMPYDFNGHGTQTMGLLLGGNYSGSGIGVAPDAKWIAAKLFDDAGNATLSDIHLAFQWLLDPDGNPATADTPDVVNASWGLIGGIPGGCNTEFNDDIHALKAAGIAVVFSAGNDGPNNATSESPANNPEGYSVGSVDSQAVIASSSSRGPSGCDNSIFPKLVAPGVNVVTADLSFGGLPVYATVSGTSFAAPHVAGLMALLGSAFPHATVADLETALAQTARDLGAAGADNTYGYGMVDGAAAYQLLAAGAGQPPSITSTAVTIARQDQPYSYQVTAVDPEGGSIAFALDTAPTGMAITSNGLIGWTPTAAQVGNNAVQVRATDPTGLAAVQAFSITVASTNRPPVSTNDAYSVAMDSPLNITAPGVLGNDSDPDGNAISAVLAAGPAHGTLTLNASGSFTYTPAAAYSGADSFSYAAYDGYVLGNTATVAITVAANQSPVAVNDSFTVPRRRGSGYTAQQLSVLANDRDADGSLAVGSVLVTSAPNMGGTAVANSDGTISYTPRLRFTGTERFRYTVKDNRGATSNVATVTVTVR
jgi:subtilisin family serine protease